MNRTAKKTWPKSPPRIENHKYCATLGLFWSSSDWFHFRNVKICTPPDADEVPIIHGNVLEARC